MEAIKNLHKHINNLQSVIPEIDLQCSNLKSFIELSFNKKWEDSFPDVCKGVKIDTMKDRYSKHWSPVIEITSVEIGIVKDEGIEHYKRKNMVKKKVIDFANQFSESTFNCKLSDDFTIIDPYDDPDISCTD
jgi:hypothetical protein